MATKHTLTDDQRMELLSTLQARFAENMKRHAGLAWEPIQAKLEANPEKLWSLHQMEITGGEPDVVGQDDATGEYIFYDCAAESPDGRRSFCYDRAALDARKANKPANSAIDAANEMGVELLTEAEYRALQELGEFDAKTSSWLKTPDAVREQGGGIFGDYRFGRVFVYHNGVQSYYAARGFRGALRV